MNKQAAVFVMMFVLLPGNMHARLAQATVIGGHFWVLESELKKMHGVLQTVAGYYHQTIPGANPVKVERAQAVRIIYNPNIISIQHLATQLSQHVFPKSFALGYCGKNVSGTKAVLAPHDVYHRGQASTKKNTVATFDALIKPMQGHFRAAGEADQDYVNEHPLQFWWYSLQCKTKRFFGRHE